MKRVIAPYCVGEKCFCGEPAEHKVEETVWPTDPMCPRHPLTAYVCHKHFRKMMGPAAGE